MSVPSKHHNALDATSIKISQNKDIRFLSVSNIILLSFVILGGQDEILSDGRGITAPWIVSIYGQGGHMKDDLVKEDPRFSGVQ